MSENKRNWAFTVLGVLLLGAGLCLLRMAGDLQGMMLPLPYLCIGVGCGLFGHGVGDMVSARALRGSPELRRQMEIEKNDERNQAIANQAKGKAFDNMTFIFGALMLCFALMEVELAAVLLLVFAYLFVHGCAIWYRVQLEREM